MQGWRPATLLKTNSNTGIFLWNLRNFAKYLFTRTSANDCFYTTQKQLSRCVQQKLLFSALNNAVMKYSFFAAGFKVRERCCKFIKNCTPSQVFSKSFTTGAEQRYWKMHLDGCFWGRIYFGNIPAWLLLKGSCKHSV